ncbi:uncharacterized protein PHALS_07742 [Plasmopara halstedii]|uniref:Uncharacterized protein n=1 Tax=Plasmopara halstedii TaxID=4781 RepID=A0A0P1B6A4_PLAHL|nr:uncharacterized protein PHALS_07742 [Plasmopara halstedii]CEG50012.1 hypothetical protein PHALS_07742 [Plasmopara halstedii]|eukprot:XP_024586381.1 hypothetical protein PHALS_07742 [Plasmopara halstedii]
MSRAHQLCTSIGSSGLSTHANVSTGDQGDAFKWFELQTRLRKLQSELCQIMVQTKIAWMQCFANSWTITSCTTAENMVQLGEKLTTNLKHAFNITNGTIRVPLKVYETLVKRIEDDMATFQNLVASVALGNFLQSQHDIITQEKSANDKKLRSTKTITCFNRLLRVDLPSMQTYCKHVAPPYSSYLSLKHKRVSK